MWMNFENTMLSESSQSQNNIILSDLFMQNIQHRQIHGDNEQINSCLEEGDWGYRGRGC